MNAVERGFRAWASAEVSSRSLALTRIFICTLFLVRFNMHWGLHKFETHPWLVANLALMFVAMWLTLVGYKTRISSIVLAATFSMAFWYWGRMEGVRQLGGGNHPFYVLLGLACSPCGRSLSIDRMLAVRRARARGETPPSERMPWLYLELFVAGFCVMYFWAGMDKIDAGWLSGDRLERIFMRTWIGSDALGVAPWLHPLSVLSAWFTTFVEFSMVPLLAWRRTRPYAMWLALLFHFGIFFTLNAPDFTMAIFASYIVCLSPQWVHRAIEDVTSDSGVTASAG